MAVWVAEGGRCGSEELVRWGSRALGAVCCVLYRRYRIVDVLSAGRIVIRLRRRARAGGGDDPVVGRGGGGESRTVASVGANGRRPSRRSPGLSAAVEPGFGISDG